MSRLSSDDYQSAYAAVTLLLLSKAGMLNNPPLSLADARFLQDFLASRYLNTGASKNATNAEAFPLVFTAPVKYEGAPTDKQETETACGKSTSPRRGTWGSIRRK